MNIWKDEEFNQKIGEIIEKEYFPDTEKVKLMSTLLETEADEMWELQKAAEKLIKTKKEQKTESLDEFLQKNVSEEQIAFNKINKGNKDKFKDEFWWVSCKANEISGVETNSLMFQPSGIQGQEFKKPRNWIRSENTRLRDEIIAANPYVMPEISEREMLAMRLTEKSLSKNSSRVNTPRTPSSRVSSIFPLYNYSLPSKRQREQSK